MCERFHCLPSQLYAEDADLFRLVAIEQRGRPPEDGAAGASGVPGGAGGW